jgi:hypothetical protein
MGVILGTGTNACYSEQTRNITKLKEGSFSGEEMIVNMEWGGKTTPKEEAGRKRRRSSCPPSLLFSPVRMQLLIHRWFLFFFAFSLWRHWQLAAEESV